MAVSTSSGGSARTFLAVLRRCTRRGGASSAAAGRRHCARVNAAAQRCRLRTMVGSRGPVGSSLCGFRALWVSSCSGVWWFAGPLVVQASVLLGRANWQLNEPYYCLYSRSCCDFCAFSRPYAKGNFAKCHRPHENGRRVVCRTVSLRPAGTAKDGHSGKKRPARRRPAAGQIPQPSGSSLGESPYLVLR